MDKTDFDIQNEFEYFIWKVENHGDLADNFHIYSVDQFYAYVGRMELEELKEAFPHAWEAFQDERK
jgi:hypothetical protein